jgi:predicted ArsR family transcriptional regulator
MAARQKPKPLPIERLPQLRTLVSSVRQEIVDTLQALGAASISEIAEQLGRPADGLYYHVRALLKAGLLRPAGKRPRRGRSEALYQTIAPERGMKLRYATQSRNGKATLERLVASMLRTAGRDFRAGMAWPGAATEGPQRELWADRGKGWISEAELRRVNALLRELSVLTSKRRSPRRHRLFSLTFVLAPGASRPTRRKSANG